MLFLMGLLALPVIEIALFVKVGGMIGLGWTLLLVLATPLLGITMIRQAGARAMSDLRGPIDRLRDPAAPVAREALTLLGGVLLILPGFLTDAIGLLLMLPPVQALAMRRLRARAERGGLRFSVNGRDPFAGEYSTGFPPRREPHRPDVIDGEFEEVEPGQQLSQDHPRRPRGPSGWTQS